MTQLFDLNARIQQLTWSLFFYEKYSTNLSTIVLVVLTTANFGWFSNFCRYYTRSQAGKSTGYRPTLKPLRKHVNYEEDKNKVPMNKPYKIQNTNICNGIFHKTTRYPFFVAFKWCVGTCSLRKALDTNKDETFLWNNKHNLLGTLTCSYDIYIANLYLFAH